MNRKKETTLPGYFRPILWSHDFSSLDPEKHKKTIILQAVNYGDLTHWRWIANRYGAATVRKVLYEARHASLRQSVRPLAAVVFGTPV